MTTTRGFAALALVALLGTACTSAPPPPPPTSAQAPAPDEPCVRLSTGQPDAAMGLRALPVELVNCGTRPYELNGFPVVRVLDEDHQPVEVLVHQGTTSIEDPGVHPLTVGPGEQAVAIVLWRNTVTDPTVVATLGAYLDVAPAEGRAAQTLPAHLDLGNTGKLDVVAWHRKA